MLGISLLMISDVRYPSFKKLGWSTRGTLGAIVIAVLLLFITVQFRYVMPVVLFSIYLLYGLLVRPWISQRLRKEIEVELEEDDADEADEADLSNRPD
jgi:CDP-diacylglycerol--serine O-phosphatidyltransferase